MELFGIPIVCSHCGKGLPEECKCASAKQRRKAARKIVRALVKESHYRQRMLGVDFLAVEDEIRDDWFAGRLDDDRHRQALYDLEQERILRNGAALN